MHCNDAIVCFFFYGRNISVNVFSRLFFHISFVFCSDIFSLFDNLTTQIKMKDYKIICLCVQCQLDDVRGSKHHWEDTRPETAIVHAHLMDCCFCGASQWSNHEPCLEKKNGLAESFFYHPTEQEISEKEGVRPIGERAKWLIQRHGSPQISEICIRI